MTNVLLTSLQALRQAGDGSFLVLESRAVLMVEPTKLLQDLRVIRVFLHNMFVRVFRASEL